VWLYVVMADRMLGHAASAMLCVGAPRETATETAQMGWSEKYWEDVESELEQSAAESEPTSEDRTLEQPGPEEPAFDQPADASGKS